MIDIQNIPDRVREAIAVRIVGQPVGKELYDRTQQTIKDYPEYFPWEAKYNSIPQKVHEAYGREKYPFRYHISKFGKDNKPFNKLYHVLKINIDAIPKKELTLQTLKELFSNMFLEQEKERERREQEKERAKELWDKYYQSYDLPYPE